MQFFLKEKSTPSPPIQRSEDAERWFFFFLYYYKSKHHFDQLVFSSLCIQTRSQETKRDDISIQLSLDYQIQQEMEVFFANYCSQASSFTLFLAN